jgi:antibiotic biosynthesis monooxygenase (ABM) superfamily enzyme
LFQVLGALLPFLPCKLDTLTITIRFNFWFLPIHANWTISNLKHSWVYKVFKLARESEATQRIQLVKIISWTDSPHPFTSGLWKLTLMLSALHLRNTSDMYNFPTVSSSMVPCPSFLYFHLLVEVVICICSWRIFVMG